MRLSDAVEALAAATAARDAMLALAARDFVDMVAEARAKYDALRVEVEKLQVVYRAAIGCDGMPVIPGSGFVQQVDYLVSELQTATKAVQVPSNLTGDTAELVHTSIGRQQAMLAMISMQMRLFYEFNDARTSANEAIYKARVRTDNTNEQYELEEKLMDLLPRRVNVLAPFFIQVPGAHHLMVDVRPFDADVVKKYHAARLPNFEAAITNASETLAAVKRREEACHAPFQAYLDGVDVQVENYGNSVAIKCLMPFPKYIRAILDEAKTPWPVRGLRNVVDTGLVYLHPGAEAIDWLVANSTRADPWYTYLVQLQSSKPNVHTTRGALTIFDGVPNGPEDAKAVLGVLRYMYEVVINRVADSHKRPSDDEVSPAKRRVIESA